MFFDRNVSCSVSHGALWIVGCLKKGVGLINSVIFSQKAVTLLLPESSACEIVARKPQELSQTTSSHSSCYTCKLSAHSARSSDNRADAKSMPCVYIAASKEAGLLYTRGGSFSKVRLRLHCSKQGGWITVHKRRFFLKERLSAVYITL